MDGITPIVTTVLVIIVGFFIYKVVRLLNDRHFASHDKRILDYLSAKKLTLVRVEKPTKTDWDRAPFEKPSSVKVSLIQIRVLGIPIDATDIEYKIITASDAANNTTRIWMRIDTSIMSEMKVIFKHEPSQ